MRDSLYAHLQRLHAGFHDAWQSGQLLSRATTDLSAIRRFAGFGTIFFITNIVTFFAVVALLIRLNWWLGLLAGCVSPVAVVCYPFEQRYRVLSRRAQDQQGDLATYVEEAAPASGCSRRSAAAARRPPGTAPRPGWSTTQVREGPPARHVLGPLDLVPNVMIGLMLLLGALAVSQARADPGRPGRVHHARAAAGLADRGDGLHPGLGPGGGHRGAAGLRDPRHRARHHRPSRAEGASRRCGPCERGRELPRATGRRGGGSGEAAPGGPARAASTARASRPGADLRST